MGLYIAGGILLFLAAYLVVQKIRCSAAVKDSRARLAAYGARTVTLSRGKTENQPQICGTAGVFCSDLAKFLLSPLFGLIMGMEPSTIRSMLSAGERKAGVVLDAAVTNLDMAKTFDDYPVEKLQAPTLVFQARDDKLVNFADTEKAVAAFIKECGTAP